MREKPWFHLVILVGKERLKKLNWTLAEISIMLKKYEQR